MTHLQYPLVCFDLDGTLVDDTIYIWKTLHEGFHTNPTERQRAYDDFFANRISYKEWFEHDLKLLRESNASKDRIIEMLDSLTVMNGALETLHQLQQRGHKLAIISGSLDLVISHLFPDFSFDHVLINQIQFDDAGQISGGIHTPYDVQAKADGLVELCQRENISTDQAAFIGDNENDLWIAQKAGLSIAFNSKSESLSEICDGNIATKDLTKILSIIR